MFGLVVFANTSAEGRMQASPSDTTAGPSSSCSLWVTGRTRCLDFSFDPLFVFNNHSPLKVCFQQFSTYQILSGGLKGSAADG